MRTCLTCSEENPDRARFCLACGEALPVEPAGESRRMVSMVFSDVVGSTELGERLDPESLRRVMARYFGEAKRIVERHGGTVEKFVGDAIMAIFGMPRIHEDDALRAVRAASEMRDALDAINEEFEETHGLRLQVRTGINTGDVVAGDPGSGEAFVSGDAVNVAARLEQNATPGSILLGGATYRLVRDAVKVQPLPPMNLKGKSEAVDAFVLITVKEQLGESEKRLESRLVGRGDDLQLLQDAFDTSAADRECQLITVIGSAGVGKSRLVAEFLAAVSDRARVARGRCLPYGEGITFWPLTEIIKDAANIVEGASVEEAKECIRSLLAPGAESDQLADILVQLYDPTAGAATVEELGWAVRRLFEMLSADLPTVIVIDDIHWAEQSLLDLIEYIAGWTRDVPLMLLCIARTELLNVRPEWGTGAFPAISIALEPLSQEASEELVAELFGNTDPLGRLRAKVTEAAAGNPLFVEQMLEMLIDDGAVLNKGGRWVAARPLDALTVPTSIRALLAARLDGLDRAERLVVERASVVGKTFTSGAVRYLSHDSVRDDVHRRLLKLVRKEFVRPDRQASVVDDAFRFRHILLRDAAYDSISKETRADLHLRFVEWLESQTGGDRTNLEEIIAFHLGEAYRYRLELGFRGQAEEDVAIRAGTYYESCGYRALNRGDFSSAEGLFRRGFELVPPSDLRSRLALRLGEALGETGDYQTASQHLEDAIGTKDETLSRYAHLELAFIRLQRDPETGLDFAHAVARRTLSDEAAEGDDRALAKAWLLMSSVHSGRAQMESGADAARKSRAHAVASGDRYVERWAKQHEISAMVRGREPIAHVKVVLNESYRDDVSPVNQGYLLFVGGFLEVLSGEVTEGLEHIAKARVDFRALGLEMIWAALSQDYGQAAVLAGDLEGAKDVLLEACEALEAAGEAAWLSTCAAQLADVYCRLGDYQRAEEWSLKAKKLTGPSDVVSQALWRTAMAKVLVARGGISEGIHLADEAVAIMGSTDLLVDRGNVEVQRAEALIEAKRYPDAAEALEKAIEDYALKGAIACVERARAIKASIP